MKTSLLITAVLSVSLLIPATTVYSQQDAGGGEKVLMLEDILIQVAPELPTVVVTIPRQKPNISPVILRKDLEALIRDGVTQVKPRLTDLQVNKIEEPQKMLAKPRSE